ncbi:MAG: bifunctional UDP-3-O-[3-hydroxymyristoyl] N-acetylglucosamine deacetylase/3-hydroxyacyl-ACP dehydratase [Saprospiraceae bacterium]|nr:bifunctional UDP-3-O-[3-hydroxymyristoyl] N-acetylglucosamine deacetylase/3-hydroxyacyl-ACP dehydratase [Saprospiraceae bacterium]
MKQRTIKEAITVKGIGLHTGQIVTLTLRPASEHHGYKFQRIDLANAPIIAADASKVAATNRGTVIKEGDAQISTIEHVLSALIGLGVDNVLLEIDGGEVPILDGSSAIFVEKINAVGIVEQTAEREYFDIKEAITYKDEKTGAEYMAIPADEYSLTTMIDFNSTVLGQQHASLDSTPQYETEIAPARTFAFLHELEFMLNQGLIKGGDLDNAIVIVDRLMTEEELADLAKKLNKPHIKIEREGILNTTDLRFSNEPARHKLLDVVGDLALVGKFIKGKIIAKKPGHTANVAFAKVLKRHYMEQKKMQGIPKYDPSVKPVMDTIQIMKKLPHRYPFLLVDKVLELTPEYIVGMKQVTMNEWFFEGHFPNNPVFPGVLQMEALAQTGGILALAGTSDDEQWDTYFLKIDNCKFRDKVLPGDTLMLKMELLEPIKRGIVRMMGRCYVGNKIVSEAELTALIQKRN